MKLDSLAKTFLRSKLTDTSIGRWKSHFSSLSSQVKSIEALARLRMRSAEPLMTEIVSARKFLSWMHPRELRVAAAQALEMLNPIRAAEVIPKSGLSQQDLTMQSSGWHSEVVGSAAALSASLA